MTELYTQAEKTEANNPEFKPIEDETPVLVWILAVSAIIILLSAVIWLLNGPFETNRADVGMIVEILKVVAWIGASGCLMLFAIVAALLGINKKIRKKAATDDTEKGIDTDQKGNE